MDHERISESGTGKAICDIKLKLPSLNEYTRACRGNAYAAGAMKKNIETAISFFLRPLPRFTNPVVIHFIWREKDRRRDLDNVAFGKKFILDAMVKCGILPNDSQKYVKGFRDDFEEGETGVRVEVEEWRGNG